MTSTLPGLSISLMALSVPRSSDQERPRVSIPLLPPEIAPIPVSPPALKKSLAGERDKVKAAKEFQPPPVRAPSRVRPVRAEPERDQSARIELSVKPVHYVVESSVHSKIFARSPLRASARS